MLKNILIQVIQNPLYMTASLISVITHRFIIAYLPSYIGIKPGIYNSFIYGFLREALLLIAASLFMAGIGSLLKKITNKGTAGPGDFIEGISNYFSKVLKINLLIFVLSLFGFSAIVKPNMIMGFMLPMFTFNFHSAVILLLSPFFILWYPAMFLDDFGVIESIKKAISIGTKAYLKLVLAVFIPLIPLFIHAGYHDFLRSLNTYPTINVFSAGYYMIFSVVFILSLYALLYIFKVYHLSEKTSSSNQSEGRG
ncbi:hypothetical protein [Candidatus Contubernalis alkaliaceticus]|uniref:hypothetical protein n=1 Tax=Candidatus Contubernalis alkaliaceticus TaxID=338645 RepID=UPI001F4C3306|nr:hypothetical protein [Candidatus Contubernalis alkalaceticus]UNC93096.1 hypothetical protein HUE98_13945 [Candidatus Contubernalis alkalaceticus]